MFQTLIRPSSGASEYLLCCVGCNDRTIPNNKPDIIIRDNEKGTCVLIDVAISGDRNVIKKEAEKILKCKDLTIKIQRMWNVKTKVIPVIKDMIECMDNYISQHMQGNRGITGQKTLVRTCAKISRNKSRRQGNHIAESTSTN